MGIYHGPCVLFRAFASRVLALFLQKPLLSICGIDGQKRGTSKAENGCGNFTPVTCNVSSSGQS